MGAALFYHLTRQPLEATLPALLEKALGAGWRVLVRGTDPLHLAALDRAIWTWRDDAFLPHGLSGGPHDADQPILLTCETAAAPDRPCLMAVGGATVTAEECAAFERVCILFDGGDAAAVQAARAQWRSLTAAGAGAQYWSEESGRWTMMAES